MTTYVNQKTQCNATDRYSKEKVIGTGWIGGEMNVAKRNINTAMQNEAEQYLTFAEIFSFSNFIPLYLILS